MPLLQSPFRSLVERWRDCERCELSKVRLKVVMSRGKIPSQLVVVAESPGIVEDLFGSPLVGSSGEELDRWIEIAGAAVGYTPSIAFMNLVGCYSNVPDRKTPEPTAKEIETCYPRLDALIKLCKPRIIIAVGKLSEKWAEKKDWLNLYPTVEKVISILHPSGFLRDRMKFEDKMQRAILALETAFEELKE